MVAGRLNLSIEAEETFDAPRKRSRESVCSMSNGACFPCRREEGMPPCRVTVHCIKCERPDLLVMKRSGLLWFITSIDQTASRACLRSLMRSWGSSVPTESRMKSGETPVESCSVLLREAVAGVGFQSGVIDPGDLGVGLEEVADGEGVFAVGLHAEVEGFESLEEGPGIEG